MPCSVELLTQLGLGTKAPSFHTLTGDFKSTRRRLSGATSASLERDVRGLTLGTPVQPSKRVVSRHAPRPSTGSSVAQSLCKRHSTTGVENKRAQTKTRFSDQRYDIAMILDLDGPRAPRQDRGHEREVLVQKAAQATSGDARTTYLKNSPLASRFLHGAGVAFVSLQTSQFGSLSNCVKNIVLATWLVCVWEYLRIG